MYDAVTLITDFGDYYPGVMKCSLISALKCLKHEASIVDICHEVEPFNVMHGAFLLYSSWKYAKAVHCAVVDPTVGGEREVLVIFCKNSAFVGPNNGILYPAAREAGIEKVLNVDGEKVFSFLRSCLEEEIRLSSTFHGRDIFAPSAALTAAEKIQEFGEEMPTKKLKKLELFDVRAKNNRLKCRVIFNDRFGNAVTNVRAERVRGIRGVWVKEMYFPMVKRITDVRVGEPFTIIGSFSTLELCVREGSAKDMGIHGDLEIELEY